MSSSVHIFSKIFHFMIRLKLNYLVRLELSLSLVFSSLSAIEFKLNRRTERSLK